jgi:hypothetical protein
MLPTDHRLLEVGETGDDCNDIVRLLFVVVHRVGADAGVDGVPRQNHRVRGEANVRDDVLLREEEPKSLVLEERLPLRTVRELVRRVLRSVT